MQARSIAADVVDRIFIEHPRALGESYWEHQRRALHFGTSMATAGLACIIHALIPAVFARTASTQVQRLHDEMHARRRSSAPGAQANPGRREPLGGHISP